MKRDTFRFLAGVLVPIGGLPSPWGCVLRPYPGGSAGYPHITDTDVPSARLTFCPAAERDALALAEARTELILREPVQTTG
jgi:hypothetical protein